MYYREQSAVTLCLGNANYFQQVGAQLDGLYSFISLQYNSNKKFQWKSGRSFVIQAL